MPTENNEQLPQEGDNSFQAAFEESLKTQQPEQTPQPGGEQQSVAEPPSSLTEAEPSEVPSQSDLARLATEAGINTDGLDDAGIARQLVSEYQKLTPYAQYGQQLAPYADQIAQMLQAEQQQSQAEPEKPEEDWSVQGYFGQAWRQPEWKETYDFAEKNGIVQRNPETGLYEAVPGREQLAMPLLGGMNETLMARQRQWEEITQGNPYQIFYDKLLEPMRRAWQEDLQKAIEQQSSSVESRDFVDRFEAENASWLYSRNEVTGQQTMTEKGQAFYEAIQQLKESGVTDPKSLLSFAKKMVDAAEALQPSQAEEQQVPPQANPEQQNQEKQQSFIQNAMDKARHSPSAGGYTEHASDHPVSVSETDLNSMFVSDFGKAGK